MIERPCLEIIQESEVIEYFQIIDGMVPGIMTKAMAGEDVGIVISKQD